MAALCPIFLLSLLGRTGFERPTPSIVERYTSEPLPLKWLRRSQRQGGAQHLSLGRDIPGDMSVATRANLQIE